MQGRQPGSFSGHLAGNVFMGDSHPCSGRLFEVDGAASNQSLSLALALQKRKTKKCHGLYYNGR